MFSSSTSCALHIGPGVACGISAPNYLLVPLAHGRSLEIVHAVDGNVPTVRVAYRPTGDTTPSDTLPLNLGALCDIQLMQDASIVFSGLENPDPARPFCTPLETGCLRLVLDSGANVVALPTLRPHLAICYAGYCTVNGRADLISRELVPEYNVVTQYVADHLQRPNEPNKLTLLNLQARRATSASFAYFMHIAQADLAFQQASPVEQIAQVLINDQRSSQPPVAEHSVQQQRAPPPPTTATGRSILRRYPVRPFLAPPDPANIEYSITAYPAPRNPLLSVSEPEEETQYTFERRASPPAPLSLQDLANAPLQPVEPLPPQVMQQLIWASLRVDYPTHSTAPPSSGPFRRVRVAPSTHSDIAALGIVSFDQLELPIGASNDSYVDVDPDEIYAEDDPVGVFKSRLQRHKERVLRLKELKGFLRNGQSWDEMKRYVTEDNICKGILARQEHLPILNAFLAQIVNSMPTQTRLASAEPHAKEDAELCVVCQDAKRVFYVCGTCVNSGMCEECLDNLVLKFYNTHCPMCRKEFVRNCSLCPPASSSSSSCQ